MSLPSRLVRRAVPILAALCALPGVAAADVPQEPAGVAEESALASWMFPTGEPGRSKWIFAGAYRNAVAGGQTITTGFAVKGTCRTMRRGGTACTGRGVEARLPEDAFRTDPAMRSASLSIHGRHELSWRGDAESPPALYVAGEACNEGKGAGGGFMQHAAATGTVFGRRVANEGVDHAILSRGAMATECTRALLDALSAGRTVRVVLGR